MLLGPSAMPRITVKRTEAQIDPAVQIQISQEDSDRIAERVRERIAEEMESVLSRWSMCSYEGGR